MTETFSVEKVKEILSDMSNRVSGRLKSNRNLKVIWNSKLDFPPSLFLDWCPLPLSVPLGWAFTFPCLYADFLLRWVSLWTDLFSDLSKKINPSHLNPDILVGKYIPNLIAKPFGISREYAQIIYDQTSSPKLDKVLKKWEQEKWASAETAKACLYYPRRTPCLSIRFACPLDQALIQRWWVHYINVSSWYVHH